LTGFDELSPHARSAAQVAFELRRDGVAAGLGQFGGILHLLQRSHVLRDLRVLGRQLVDAALPRPGQLGELTEIEGGVEQPLQLGKQGKRGLGTRRMRDVVRDCRPECQDFDSRPRKGVAEHADDASWALIGCWCQAELLHQLAVAGRHRHRDRTGVRGVGKQGAQQVYPSDVC
jgi:hypothetical protein